MLVKTCLFLGEGTNEQDPVKCSGVGCENLLHRWYVVEVISVCVTSTVMYIIGMCNLNNDFFNFFYGTCRYNIICSEEKKDNQQPVSRCQNKCKFSNS